MWACEMEANGVYVLLLHFSLVLCLVASYKAVKDTNNHIYTDLHCVQKPGTTWCKILLNSALYSPTHCTPVEDYGTAPEQVAAIVHCHFCDKKSDGKV